MKLISLGLSLWLLVDSSGGLYPLAKDSMGGMKQLPLLVGGRERRGEGGRERRGREGGREGEEREGGRERGKLIACFFFIRIYPLSKLLPVRRSHQSSCWLLWYSSLRD